MGSALHLQSPEKTSMWPFKRKSKRSSVADIEIVHIEIDNQGRLCVKPASGDFEMVYRQAMEVYWDRNQKFLFSPTPKEMTYPQWFTQIVLAIFYEYGVKLRVTQQTQWANVSPSVRAEISAPAPTRAW